MGGKKQPSSLIQRYLILTEPQTADGGLREPEPPPSESSSIPRLPDDLSLQADTD